MLTLRFGLPFVTFTILGLAQYTPIFPGGVVTDASIGVVSYIAESTLAAGIDASQTTLTVQTGHGALFAVNNFVIVDLEQMLITAIATDTLTVTRAFAGSTAATHSSGAPIVNATLPDYHNRMAAEMKAVQANVLIKGNNLSDVTTAATARTNLGAAPLASPTFTGTVTGTFSGNLTGAVTGNASTATALAANGANCSTDQAAGGVTAAGAAESCLDLPALYQPVDADLTALAALAATAGLTARTGAGAFAVRTFTGTANQITVTNGDGSAGNPTLSIPSSPTLPGTTTGTFSGNLTGSVTGNASTATALAADPANCTSGFAANGVTAAGVADSCIDLPGTYLPIVTGVNAQTGTTYTLVAGDNGKTITFNNASAITLTVPTGLGAGFNCLIIQLGAGDVTPTVSGTTILQRQSLTKTAGQYAAASLLSHVSNSFILSGDLQ